MWPHPGRGMTPPTCARIAAPCVHIGERALGRRVVIRANCAGVAACVEGGTDRRSSLWSKRGRRGLDVEPTEVLEVEDVPEPEAVEPVPRVDLIDRTKVPGLHDRLIHGPPARCAHPLPRWERTGSVRSTWGATVRLVHPDFG
jgi:hypothetical protein